MNSLLPPLVFFLSSFFPLAWLGMELRALCRLWHGFTAESHPQHPSFSSQVFLSLHHPCAEDRDVFCLASLVGVEVCARLRLG